MFNTATGTGRARHHVQIFGRGVLLKGWGGGGRQHPEKTLVSDLKWYRTVPHWRIKLSGQLSLRGLSRTLGYSVATLSEHRNAGIFRALPNGKYDLEAVVKGLLASTSPSTKHRTNLEANGVRKPEQSLTPEQQALEDKAVAAVMSLVNSDVVCDAVGRLGRLPRQMLAAVQKHDPVEYPQNTLAGFERQIVEWVIRCIEAARDE